MAKTSFPSLWLDLWIQGGAPKRWPMVYRCLLCILMYTHTYSHTHTHIHTHIYIYIYTYTPRIPENDGFISEQAQLGGISVYRCPFRKSRGAGLAYYVLYIIYCTNKDWSPRGAPSSTQDTHATQTQYIYIYIYIYVNI